MEPRPLSPRSVTEVPLPEAPLAAVIAQVRFSPILTIGQPHVSEVVAAFQERLRSTYPHLSVDHTHHITMANPSHPHVAHSQIWRLADSASHPPEWRVSLAQDFVSLETRQYDSRDDFLSRLQDVIEAVGSCFSPTESTRFGLRYIDRLVGSAQHEIANLVKPEVLGMLASNDTALKELESSITNSMMHTHFLAPDGDTVMARWGVLPSNATYDPDVLEPVEGRAWVLDMDMFTTRPHSFSDSALVSTARAFAECLYWLFRQMVTDDFLRHHGGSL